MRNEEKNSLGEGERSQLAAPTGGTFPSIIVRTYGDEPRVLYAMKMQDDQRYVNVGRVPPHAPIGWPLEDAFDYSAESYADLVAAYDAGDKERLTAIYEELRAKPRQFMAALNKAKRIQ